MVLIHAGKTPITQNKNESILKTNVAAMLPPSSPSPVLSSSRAALAETVAGALVVAGTAGTGQDEQPLPLF